MKNKRNEMRVKLLAVGKEIFNALKHVEYACPNCGGVASIGLEDGWIIAECHACSLRAAERI